MDSIALTLDIDWANEFKKLIAAGGELRLSVKRWTRGRVVKIKIELPTTKTQPAIQPTIKPEPQPTTQPTG